MVPDTWAYRLDFVALLLLFFLIILRLTARCCSSGVTDASGKSAKPKGPPRPLRPRTPDDCAECVRACAPSMSPDGRLVRPWREVKSSRGRPKRINTKGYACDNEQCAYCGFSDATIYALVGYGHHGVDRAIQDLFCQACGHKFSVRRHTALYRLKTAAPRVAEVLAALAEGLSVVAAGRVFGHAEGTITTWLTRAGTHNAGLHTRLFHGLGLVKE